jgi:hypothetical protein
MGAKSALNVSKVIFFGLLNLMFLSCSEEKKGEQIGQTVNADSQVRPNGSLKTSDEQEITLPDLGEVVAFDSEYFRADLSGIWISREGKVKMNIQGRKFIFHVNAEYSTPNYHPQMFSFDTRSPLFEYRGRKYKIFYEGSQPTVISLIWKNISDDNFNREIVLIKER